MQCKEPVLLDCYGITFGMQMQVPEVFYTKTKVNVRHRPGAYNTEDI